MKRRAYLPNVVEVTVWYALLGSQLCFLVEEDVEVEPRFQQLQTLEAQRLHWTCMRRRETHETSSRGM